MVDRCGDLDSPRPEVPVDDPMMSIKVWDAFLQCKVLRGWEAIGGEKSQKRRKGNGLGNEVTKS